MTKIEQMDELIKKFQEDVALAAIMPPGLYLGGIYFVLKEV